MEHLLTIGEFAQRCGLSRSALRFYDQSGLLRPRLVDAETGYRYYSATQVSEALLVRRLRAAELSVAVLSEYLVASPARRMAILEAHSASFRRRARAVQTTVDALRAELGDVAHGDVECWCAVAPEEFAGAMDQVRFAVADPAERAELGGVWLETREGSVRLVATDSYRLAVRDLVPLTLGPSQIRGVIDAGRAREIAAELSSATSLTLTQDADGTISACIDGRSAPAGGTGEGFPDYERILSGLPSGHQIVLARDELEQALETLGAEGAQVSLHFSGAGLALESATGRVSAQGHWPGPELTILLDRRFMAEAVRATVGPDLVIAAADALTPVTLRSADTGTFSVLTMPIGPPTRA